MLKLVTAVVKPFKLDEVKDALKGAGVAGHDRLRGAGLRPPGRAHRGLPGSRVQGRLPAQGEAGGHRRAEQRGPHRRRSSAPPPAPARSATARSGSPISTRSSASAPVRWAPTPSDPASRHRVFRAVARLHRDDLLDRPTLRGSAFCRALTDRFDRWLRQLYVTATGAPDRVALVAVGGYGRRRAVPPVGPRPAAGARRPRRRRPPGRAALVPDLGRGGEARPCGVHAQGGAAPGRRGARHRHLAARRPPRRRRRRHHRPSWSARPAASGSRSANRWLPKPAGGAGRADGLNPGEVAFVLEPDLKLGRGGLRDAHMLRWLEVVEPGLLDGDRQSRARRPTSGCWPPGWRCTCAPAGGATCCCSRSRTAWPRTSAIPTPTR